MVSDPERRDLGHRNPAGFVTCGSGILTSFRNVFVIFDNLAAVMRQLLRVTPIAVMICLVVPTMTPSVVSARSVDQQRSEVERIVDELERLEQRANDIGEQYVEAVDEKAHLDEEIVVLEAEIADQEVELAALQASLAEMAVRSYMGAGTTPLGPLFEDTDEINDVLQREELARVALSAGDVTTDEIDAFVDDLEDDRAALDDKRDEAQELADSLIDAKEETDRLTEEYTQARVEAEAKLGELIVEEEARRAAESLARVQAEVAAQQQQQQSSGGGSGNGGGGNGGEDNGGGEVDPAADTGGGEGGGSTGGAPAPEATPTAEAPAPAAAPPPVAAAPPPSSRSGVAVNAAMSQLNVPYKYATENPGVSFDCSGLTKYAWGQAGVYLPHQSRQQYASIPHVDPGSAQPGDLIFYYSPISHVGVYLGGGQQVHAPNTGSYVKVGNVNWNNVTGVGRPG
jgi:peptidoglycan DL-endopeptidase CwlO